MLLTVYHAFGCNNMFVHGMYPFKCVSLAIACLFLLCVLDTALYKRCDGLGEFFVFGSVGAPGVILPSIPDQLTRWVACI